MKKCDIIIPVYNAPQWVKLCVYSLFANTSNEIINKVIIVDDCSDEQTKNLLNNLANKYEKIKLITNKKNKGFVKNCNTAFEKSNADYVLLLNTDCIITKNTIEKLMKHCEKNPKIGLICPVSSNAANLSLDMFKGFNFSQMNELLEKKFLGQNFDACTVVGNCLMITKECLKKTGKLDEIYGTGYGEETDYQFRAMANGFEAKVAIDTYVFHKSEVSFGISKEKKERLEKNRKIFFERWGKEYNELSKVYMQNDPINYILSNINEEDKKVNVNTLFYLTDLVQNAGGVHVIVDIVNYLAINNVSCNLLINNIGEYKEILLFDAVNVEDIDAVNVNQIVSTIYTSTFLAKKICERKNIPLINLVQGYETMFENGSVYGIAELSYKLSDHIITISKYLQNEIEANFKHKSTLIPNGINLDLLKRTNQNDCVKTITMILRNNVMKGDWLLLNILKKITNQFNDLNVNIIYMNKYIEFPKNYNETIKINKILGPLPREEISKILSTSDVFIDASLDEGFGLMPLEAMAEGCIPIVSNSHGILEYIKNEKNGFIIDNINETQEYIEKLAKLVNDPKFYMKIKNNIYKEINKYDFDKTIEVYKKYFLKKKELTTSNNKYDKEEQKIIDEVNKTYSKTKVMRSKVYYLAKIIPKPIKNKLKRVITILYNMFQH